MFFAITVAAAPNAGFRPWARTMNCRADRMRPLSIRAGNNSTDQQLRKSIFLTGCQGSTVEGGPGRVSMVPPRRIAIDRPVRS